MAFLGRTSTLVMQDPVASMRRQVRGVQAKLPPGGSSRPGTGTSSPAAWTSSSAATAPPTSCSPISASRVTAAWRTCWPRRSPPTPGSPSSCARTSSDPAGTPSTRSAWKRSYRRPGCRCSPPMSRSTWKGSTRPPSWSAASSRAWRSGTGCRSSRKPGKACVSTPWPGGTSASPPTGTPPQRFPHPVPVKAAQGAVKTRLVLDPVRAPLWRRFSPGAPSRRPGSLSSPTG